MLMISDLSVDLNEVSGTWTRCFVCGHLYVQKILRKVSDYANASTATIKY